MYDEFRRKLLNEATGKQLYNPLALEPISHFVILINNKTRPTPLQMQLALHVLNICHVSVFPKGFCVLLSHVFAFLTSTAVIAAAWCSRSGRDETLVLTPWFLGSPLTAIHPDYFHVWQFLAGSAAASVERLWHIGPLLLPWFSFPFGFRTAICLLLMRPNGRTRHTFKTSNQELQYLQ